MQLFEYRDELDIVNCDSSEYKKVNEQIINVKVEGPIKVHLIAVQSQKVIATSTLNVFVNEYKKRTRQRHAWSIIQ